MLRPASRCLLRQPVRSFPTRTGTRFISTTPPHLKSRSWKSSAVRWGLALGGIYYYNTSTLFAEEPPLALQEPPSIPQDDGHEALASLSPSSRLQPPSENLPSDSPKPTNSSPPSIDPKTPPPGSRLDSEDQSPQELEEDAASQGAFNEETGEINWDCPCLGGMAHGPCGEEFRAAFSCFVYSKEEPKGMDCIDRFRGMQDCFREHPDIYGAELDDEEETDGMGAGEEGATVAAAMPEDAPGVAATHSSKVQGPIAGSQAATSSAATTSNAGSSAEESKEGTVNEKRSIYDTESDDLVPKAAHDATGSASNTEK